MSAFSPRRTLPYRNHDSSAEFQCTAEPLVSFITQTKLLYHYATRDSHQENLLLDEGKKDKENTDSHSRNESTAL